MDSIIKRIIMVIFHIFPLTLPAQTFEWLNNTKSILGESFTSTSMDSSGTIAVVGNFQRELLFNNDTIRFTNNINSAFVCKYYSDSRLAWVKAFQNCNFEKVVSQNNGDIIVFGSARDTLHTTLGSIIASNTNRTSFLLKFDSVGLLIGMKALGFNSNSVSILNLKLDPAGNINLLGYYSANFFVLGTLVTKSMNLGDGVIMKISSDLENLQQLKTATNCSFSDATFDKQQNIYLIGTLSSNTNTSIFDTYSFTPNNSDIILCKINSLNTFSWVKRFGGSNHDIGESITINNHKIYFCGSFINSSVFSQISITSNPSNTQNGFIGIADTSGNVENIKHGFNYCQFKNIGIAKNGNLMLMGTYNDSFKYDGFNLYSPISNCIFIAKLDPQLNGLWFLSLNFNGGVSSVLSSPNFEIYFSGSMYTNSMQFGPFFRFFNTINNNGFLVKLSDNYIKINDLQTYQLCTHDSIQIPYTSYGKYQANNVFTLELSDTNGVFLNQNNLIIGQRQDSLSGIIYAKIPNNIHASNKYKMRIKSSHPLIVSDYDSNYFNIQAKAFAHAGSDTLQCFGQQLLLGSNQSNAQNYLWSPASFLTDSSAKLAQTIIPEMSGKVNFVLKAFNQHCAAFDTTTVRFLGPINIQFTQDTSLCYLDTFTLKPVILGGDSSFPKNLSWYAYSYDSLAFVGAQLNTQLSTNTRYYLVATDACSLPDTNEVFVQILRANKLILSQDTALCAGHTLRLSPQNLWPDSQGYSLNWTDSLFNSISVADTLVLNLSQSQKNYLISSHVCDALPDTFTIHITQYQPLQMQISSDSIVCRLDTLAIKILLSGGNPLHYKATWGNGHTDSSTRFVFDTEKNQYQYTYKTLADGSTKMHITISDNCAAPITDTVSILTHLPLTFAIQKNDVCEGNPTYLLIETNGGKKPLQYLWQSLADRTIISDKDTLYLQSAQDTSFFISLTDACKQTDSLIYEASFFPKPKASFQISELQYYPGRTALSLSNTSISQGTSKYLWRIDGNTSLDENPSTYFYTSGIKNISLWLSNQYNCSDSASLDTLILVNQESEIYLPNAIHLSGTGLNETFEPIGLNIATYQLKIYNRWGVLVYETNNNNAPFNGKDQSGIALPAAVYFYTLNLETTYGKTVQKTGNVTVVR